MVFLSNSTVDWYTVFRIQSGSSLLFFPTSVGLGRSIGPTASLGPGVIIATATGQRFGRAPRFLRKRTRVFDTGERTDVLGPNAEYIRINVKRSSFIWSVYGVRMRNRNVRPDGRVVILRPRDVQFSLLARPPRSSDDFCR